MLSDIEIASQKVMRPVLDIAGDLGIAEDELDLYGRYKAKLDDSLYERLADRPDGRLVLVTAINPTPAGEGKTTTTVGLGQALNRLGHRTIIALREPSRARYLASKAGQPVAVMRRSCRWRISISIHRRYPCHHGCQQSDGSLDRQPYPPGQHPRYRSAPHCLEALPRHERPRFASYCRWLGRQGRWRPARRRLQYLCRFRNHGSSLPGNRPGRPESPARKDGCGLHIR